MVSNTEQLSGEISGNMIGYIWGIACIEEQ
jgi:hypothetical protein